MIAPGPAVLRSSARSTRTLPTPTTHHLDWICLAAWTGGLMLSALVWYGVFKLIAWAASRLIH